MTSTQLRIVLAMSALLVSARSAASQQVERADSASHPSKPPQYDRPPTTFELGATSVGGAAAGAVIGGFAGFAIDGAYCKRHHGREPSLFLSPCFLYVGYGSAIGWFGGTPVGATWGAAQIAKRRGCDRDAAITRSALGATVGLASGLLILAPSSGRYPPSRSIFTIGAPVLSGIGAAFAVRGCRAP